MHRGKTKSVASGGEGGEATLGKNTSKADCHCASPLVPRGKSQWRSPRASPASKAGDYAESVTSFQGLVYDVIGFNLSAFGGEGAEATLDKNTSKIYCECSLLRNYSAPV